jgi:YgiT-type zinc finger domain-containing protein
MEWNTLHGGAGNPHLEATAVSSTSSTRCTACHHGALTPTRLKLTFTYDGKSVSIDDDDALVCDTCGDELTGEQAAALLLTQRALAPHAEMTATVTWRTERV